MFRKISLGLMAVVSALWFSAKPTAAGLPGAIVSVMGTTYTVSSVFNCPTVDGGMVTVITMGGGGGTVVVAITSPGS
jgi:hypothetical protein